MKREREKRSCVKERERFELFVFEVVFRLLRFRSRQREREKMDPGKRSNVNIPVLGGTEPILKT